MKTVYHWIGNNAEPEYPTPLIPGSPFLHAYYKIFSQLFIDDGTNPISLYTKNKPFSDTQSNTTPPLVHSDIKIRLPLDSSKQLSTNFTLIVILALKSYTIHFHNTITFHSLKNGYPFS